MKYNIIADIIILMLIVIEFGYSQEMRLKKSEYDDLMVDLRLRKQSLEREREYLKKFLDSLQILDSLKNDLENCKKSLSFNYQQGNLDLNEFISGYSYDKKFHFKSISRNRK